MTPGQFLALFDTFEVLAVRLEALPAYDVADYEGARLAAFRAGRALPLRSVRNDPWLARIAASTASGKQWCRVRIVDDPLTEYQRFEIAVYPETQAVGEEILIVRRADATDDGPDVWLFDPGTALARAVVMLYDDAGGWLGADLTDDPDTIAVACARWRHLQARALPLNHFLAGPGA